MTANPYSERLKTEIIVAGGFRYAQRMGRKRFLPAEQSERNALMGVDMPLRSRVRHFAWR